MYLRQLKLFNFRNLRDGAISFGPEVNVVVGKNGQGKTNLVEAINFLSLTRSFRTTNPEELIRWGEHSASVFGEVASGRQGWSGSATQLGIAITPKGKELSVDGKKVSSVADFVGRLICVSFSPTDIAMVKGSPSLRRKFIDRHLVDTKPALMHQLLSYQRALNSKNALLKAGYAGMRELEPWNLLLAENAVKITQARLQFIAALSERAKMLQGEFSLRDGELSLSLDSSLVRSCDGILTLENAVSFFTRAADRELRLKSSAVGPHRDDLSISLAGHDARAYASQGQARSIVLSLKLAAIALLDETLGEKPTVLLDDVDSELDAGRAKALFQIVLSQQRQIFITGTELRPEVSAIGEISLMHVDTGVIS